MLQTPDGKTIALVAVLCSVGAGSFFLGRVSVFEGGKDRSATAWCALAPQEMALPVATDREVATAAATIQTGEYVGSRSGSVYHLPWCSGAQRIAEENKVWFETQEEAEAAGYRAAKNCPGLQ